MKFATKNVLSIYIISVNLKINKTEVKLIINFHYLNKYFINLQIY